MQSGEDVRVLGHHVVEIVCISTAAYLLVIPSHARSVTDVALFVAAVVACSFVFHAFARLIQYMPINKTETTNTPQLPQIPQYIEQREQHEQHGHHEHHEHQDNSLNGP